MSNKFITVDVETEGLSPYKDKLVFIGYRVNGVGEIKEVNVDKGEVDHELKRLLADPSVLKRGHNIKFDAVFLNRNGYTVLGVLDDTRILAYLADPFRKLDLESLSSSYLSKNHIGFGDIFVRPKNRLNGREYVKMDKKYVLREALIEKNKEDIELCDELRSHMYSNDWYKDVEQDLIKLIYDMEIKGIKIDVEYLKQLKREHQDKLDDLKVKIGVKNPNSTQQIEQELLNRGLPLAKYSLKGKNGHYSTGKLVLKRIAWSGEPGCEYVKDILRHRELQKLNSTYINPLIEDVDENERIHGQFNQAGKISRFDDSFGTATGRLSSSNPNLQNIPARTEEGRKIRRAFIPSINNIMFCTDLRQIEPRLLAHYAQAPKLIDAFKNGVDTHAMFAADIFNKPLNRISKIERFIGKTCWLATIYGCTAKRLKETVELNSEDPIIFDVDFYKEVQRNFWIANPEILAWRRYHVESTRKTGRIITYGNRVIQIPNLNSRSKFGPDGRYSAERKAVNYLIQGGAADIMKLIMLEFSKVKKLKMMAVVHDEILGETLKIKGECIDTIKIIIDQIMTQTCQLKNIPIEADTKIIKNWGEAK